MLLLQAEITQTAATAAADAAAAATADAAAAADATAAGLAADVLLQQ